MSTAVPADHQELLARARRARRAAELADSARLQKEASQLLADFVLHVRDERDRLRRLGPRVAARLLGSQARLQRKMVGLAVASEASDLRPCVRMATEIEAMLAVQAARENRVLATAAA